MGALVTRNSKEAVQTLHDEHWIPLGLKPFRPAISRDDPFPAKPDPSALSAIADQWEVPLGPELLMVGDSPKYDVGFGKQAGVRTALLSGSAHSSDHERDEPPADFTCENLAFLALELYSSFDLVATSKLAGSLKKYATPTPTSD